LTVPRFVVAPAIVQGDLRELDAETIRHLRVLRLRVGDAVVLTDGDGGQRGATIEQLDPGRAIVTLRDEPVPQNESCLELTLCVALLKRDKLEWVVEKGTELGVTRFVLVETERSCSEAGRVRVDRLTRVARAAVEQSQRCRVPDVDGPLRFAAALDTAADPAERYFFWEDAGIPTPDDHPPAAASVTAMVGPEGGFSVREADAAAAAGWRLVGLGPRILRAETAAIAAATILQFLRGDLAGTGSGSLTCRSAGRSR
jgi:16S rRNA (uracil1498-N3)-methyltransferase